MPGRVNALDSRAPLTGIAGYLIRRSQQVHNMYWSELTSGDLTSPQYAVLSALASHPGTDQQTVGALASLDKSSVADVVARLVRKSWLERTRASTDARRYVLTLTPAAAIALSSITPTAAAVQERLLVPLTPGRRTSFVDELAAVARPPRNDATGGQPDFPVLDLRVPGHLIRCAQQVHTAIWGEVVGSDLTGPQYAVLHVVSRSPGINQRQLGELAALDKSSTADIVARLVERGRLLRERDPRDGRGRVLTVPAEEVDRLRSVHPQVAEVQRRLLEPLPSSVHESFLRDLSWVAFAGQPPLAALTEG